MILACLFVVALCGLAARNILPFAVPAIYLTASLAAWIAYGADKSAARAGAWRIPESTLHILAVIGGWPGALMAQQVLRHKSSKPAFRRAFWATVILNCGALGLFWLLNSS